MRNGRSDELISTLGNNLQWELTTWGLRLNIASEWETGSVESELIDSGATQIREAQFIEVQIVSGIGLIFAVVELTVVCLSGGIK